MSKIRRLVSQRLRDLRGDVTQKALAKKAGVSVYVIGKIEREETTPSLETVDRLCRALGVTASEFFASTPRDGSTVEIIEGLTSYLALRSPADVEFADQMVRDVLGHIERTRPAKARK